MRNKKFIGLSELALIVLSLFAFSYLLSLGSTPLVSAQEDGLSGCCLETKEGAICQNIPLSQSGLCKSSLVGTGCNVLEQCQLGCCYSPNTGTCAMRAPKEKCLENGGNWSGDASCNIPQCQLGCCVMGDQVSLTNSRECSLLSNKFDFEKSFIAVNPGESCEKYTGLEKQGACLTDSGDYSGKNKCSFTTRKNCLGDFREDYLCTSEKLNSVCERTKKTTCVDGKDQIYFIDSCGNLANVYDASKVDDQSYWERPIGPKDSCADEGAGCGNCNYIEGSICVAYEQGKTAKPTFGDYSCKNLNCGERKHGESWCVYDFDPNSGIAPVGSRHFLASCFEGEISIEGCADFNQEICAQSTDTSFGFTEAKCLVNDWRSCINANDADSYAEVQKKCDENPQCIMFNDLYGEDNLKRSDGEFFAGFDPDKTNAEQGSIGKLGEDQNKILAHCVPRFTPGFQFWTTTSSVVGSGSSTKQASSANYGGSNEETSAVCSLGSFSCVSQIHRDCTLVGGCGGWKDDERNWECNYDGANSNIKGKDLPALLSAMNERCRALGSCGVSSNIEGETNSNSSGFSVKRIKIDSKGKTQENFDVTAYGLSSDYLSSISKSTPTLTKLEQIKSSSGGLAAEVSGSAGTTGNPSGGVIDLKKMASMADIGSSSSSLMGFLNFAGPLTMAGLSVGGWGWLTTPSKTIVSVWDINAFSDGGGWVSSGKITPGDKAINGLKSAGITIGATIIGSYLGGQLGGMIAKNQNWSPGKKAQFSNFMASVGGVVGYVGGAMIVEGGVGAGLSSLAPALSFGFVGLVVAIIYMIYEAFLNSYEEQEYFIMQFTCEAWQPPSMGNCESCNDDVRPCSEYRCKSLGSKCNYFVENGEPGYCATVNEIWSAQISPWQEILTGTNEYTSVQRNGFKIQDNSGQGVEARKSLTFGIVTDKPATCKIDFEHTEDYSQMKYEMSSSVDSDSGKADGTHHSIELNSFAGKSGSATTIGLAQGGENEYYIRCMNFAGQANEAEFVVQVKARDGPDLTPPELRRFYPENGAYLKEGTNSSDIILYLNEPAECRFDYEYDAFSGQEYFGELRQEMFCMTDKSSVFLGEWRCFAKLENLAEGENNLYFRCKDQPDLEESANYPRNANFVSTNYKLNVCSDGLDISLLNTNTFIEEKNFTLSVATSGCLGDAICSFRMKNYSELFNVFFKTGEKVHSQLLTLPQGEHEIEVYCEDEAGNVANKIFSFNVYFDELPPKVSRVMNSNGKIDLVTDEEAECMYETNKSIGCGFDFLSSSLSYLSKEHSFNSNPLETYFVKCRDAKLNLPQSCSLIIKPIKLGQ